MKFVDLPFFIYVLILCFKGLKSSSKSSHISDYCDNPLCVQMGLAFSRHHDNHSNIDLTLFLPKRVVATLFKDDFEFVCLSALGRVACTVASTVTTTPSSPLTYYTFQYDEVDTKTEASSVLSESRNLTRSIGAITAHVMVGNASLSSVFSFEQRDVSYFVRDISESMGSLSRIVDISYPPYGMLTAGPLKVLFACDASVLATELEAYDGYEQLSALAYSEVDFEVQSIFKQSFPADAQVIDSLNGDIEPASWFFQLRPKIVFPLHNPMQMQEQLQYGSAFGLPNHGYIEFVLTREGILRNQLFNNQATQEYNMSSKVAPLPLGSVRNRPVRDRAAEESSSAKKDCKSGAEGICGKTESASPPLHICIWGSNDMDGQKRIWLQQIESLGKIRTDFRFSWVLSLIGGKQLTFDEKSPELFREQNREFIEFGNSVLKQLLTHPHCRVVNSPFNGFSVQVDDLEQRPDKSAPSSSQSDFSDYGVPSSGPAIDVWQGDMERLYAYAHNRFTLSRGNVSALSPLWVEGFYTRMREFLLAEKCDLVVYGNSRGFSSDVLITDVCGLLGYPTATELLNLFADTRVLADAVIAPSKFALQHESIGRCQLKLREAYRREKGTEMITAIVQPGVDVWHTFNPATYFSERDRGEILGDAFEGRRRAFSVGFIGRLAPEKSVGLFLQAAHAILRVQPFCRFVVIGDGDLRSSLEELAQRLGIYHAGWISTHEKLALHLLSLDIVINTSLRAWSETFCISNIEAMSLAVPLITFAVGGIGEYVRRPSVGDLVQLRNFSVSPNAIVVHDAHPNAIAEAALYLLANSTLRKSIGRAGRQTVVDYFNTDRQMQQYALLYRDIIRRKGRSKY